jgi:DNA-binding NarL/FixJ family response regulator
MARAHTLMLIGRRALIREGVTSVLRCCAGVRRIMVVEDVADALAQLQSGCPTLILVDCDSLGAYWGRSLRRLREFSNGIPILLLGDRRCDPGLGSTCIPECIAWLPMSVDGDSLAQLVNDMMSGRSAAGPAEPECVQHSTTPKAKCRTSRELALGLTPTEMRVLKHLALGHTVRQAASSLRKSPKTVDNHKTQIMRKLKLHDRASLVHYAVREGLVALRTDTELRPIRREHR